MLLTARNFCGHIVNFESKTTLLTIHGHHSNKWDGEGWQLRLHMQCWLLMYMCYTYSSTVLTCKSTVAAKFSSLQMLAPQCALCTTRPVQNWSFTIILITVELRSYYDSQWGIVRCVERETCGEGEKEKLIFKKIINLYLTTLYVFILTHTNSTNCCHFDLLSPFSLFLRLHDTSWALVPREIEQQTTTLT